MGNLTENARVALILIDYGTRTRIKIWGRAEILDMTARGPRIVVTIDAWDVNCQQHLPDIFGSDTIARAQQKLLERIAEPETELARAKSG